MQLATVIMYSLRSVVYTENVFVYIIDSMLTHFYILINNISFVNEIYETLPWNGKLFDLKKYHSYKNKISEKELQN